MSKLRYYTDASDADLIRACRNDADAFAAPFDRHAIGLRDWLRRETGDSAVANDLVAETFARAWLSAGRFRGESPDSGRAWLFGIARKLALHHHRHGRVERSARRRLEIQTALTTDDGTDAVIDKLDALAEGPAAREALDQLENNQRLAIAHRVFDGLSYSEVAARLGCEPATARTRVHRGLRKLRTSMQKEAANG
jgi:RNA polymerase sigma factor (sigma-70 family)